MMRLSKAAWHTDWVRVVVAIAGVVGLLWLVVVIAPPWFVDDQSLEGLKAQNEVRTTLLQGLAGAVLLAGAYFAYRQLHTTREQLHTAQEGQITERYTRAIEQLGHDKLDVRLGGIYALERIARDSPTDRVTIGEVLTAFVRSHAPWPQSPPGQDAATAELGQIPDLRVRAPDVQATMTVLGRGGFAPPKDRRSRLDLTAVDLRHARLWGAHLEKAFLAEVHLEGAELIGAHLEGADLSGAHLEEASLTDAHLEKAWFPDAHLEEAWLPDAHLEEANLSRAHLEEAFLSGAHLEGAFLSGAHLEGAFLSGAHLEGADLSGAHLEGADLSGAHLEGADLDAAHLEGADLDAAHLEGANLDGVHLERAEADENTSWPSGFGWRTAGVVVRGEDNAAGPP